MASSCHPKPTVLKGFGTSLGGVPVLPLPKHKEFGYKVFRMWHKEALGPLDPKYDVGREYRLARFCED